MHGVTYLLPNTPSWRGAQLKAQGQLYLYLILGTVYIVNMSAAVDI